MIGEFMRGARHLSAGLALMRVRELRRFVYLPLGINVVLFALALFAAIRGLSIWVDRLTGALPQWLDWLGWLLWPLLLVGLLVALFVAFGLLASLAAAPFNAALARRCHALVSGKQVLPLERPWYLEAVCNISHEIAKLSYYLCRAVPLAILLLIPFVNVFALVLWLVFTSWALALEYLDYPLSEEGVSFSRQRALLRERPALVLGFGVAALMLTLVLLANFLLMPAAVAGAARLWALERNGFRALAH